MNKIVHQKEARDGLIDGAKTLYDAVKVTMGPKGRNVIVRRNDQLSITHDGVTVAQSIRTNDNSPQSNGIELIKQSSEKMNNDVGDGTTTVTVLTYNILEEANKLIDSGANPMVLKRELEQANKEAQELLDKATETLTEDSLEEVATISAGDKEIGKIVAEPFKKIGADGTVTVEASQSRTTSYEIVDGYKCDYGYISHAMVTNADKLESVYKDPYILVVPKQLGSIHELLPLLEKILASNRKELLIVSDSLEGEALANILFNRAKGIMNTIAVNIPSFRKDIYEEICAVTDAVNLDSGAGYSVTEAGLDVLGTAQKIIVTVDSLTIVGGKGDTATLLSTLTDTKEDKERKSRIQGNVCVMSVGGETDLEIEEKIYRIEDAVSATRSALQGGIVCGGGLTLNEVSKKLPASTDGHKILKQALTSPCRIILDNAGFEQTVIDKVLNAKSGYGIDVMKGEELVDLRKAGVIDPAKVTKEALNTAVSIASMIITIGAVVLEDRKSNDN